MKNKIRVTLRSNFHASTRSTIEVEPNVRFTDAQISKVNRQLCAYSCMCGGIYDAYVDSPAQYKLYRTDDGEYYIK